MKDVFTQKLHNKISECKMILHFLIFPYIYKKSFINSLLYELCRPISHNTYASLHLYFYNEQLLRRKMIEDIYLIVICITRHTFTQVYFARDHSKRYVGRS